MPRASNKEMKKAKEMFEEGMPMVEIGKKLGIPAGTIRVWKNRGWGEKSQGNATENVTKSVTESVTESVTGNVTDDVTKNVTQNVTNAAEKAEPRQRKRGAPYGNQNSKGVSKGKGNPHPKPQIKHGVYMTAVMDTLDEDEKALVGEIPEDEELLALEEVRIAAVRERRIMKAINERREQKYSVAFGESKDVTIARWEQELSSVQSKKLKAIDVLSRIRLDRQKLDNVNKGNDVADDWIAAVMGDGDGNDDE